MKYYCIGIKGAGMSTLASILYDLGNEVTGYDDTKEYKFTCDGLIKRNIEIYSDNEHPLDKDMIVTYSVAIPETHREIVRCKEQGLKIVKYNEIVGDITNMFTSICVTGTHGKTTTSSLIKHVLDNTIKTNYFIGDGTGFVSKDNKYFVIESDEFNRHFLAYHPSYTVITNIEEEHMEIYKDIDDLVNTFTTFANKTKNLIVACGDNKNIRRIKFEKDVIYYGFNKDNEYYIDNLAIDESGTSFDIYHHSQLVGNYKAQLYGEHMALNALASYIICSNLGIEDSKIKELFLTFKNAKRRFETTMVQGTTIIDDYAHHPTEIAVTLKAAKEKYKDKKVIAVFKPNTYSRTKDFYKEFQDALNIADKAYLTEIDCNRENPSDYEGVSSKMILDGLNNGEMVGEDTIGKFATTHKGDVIVFMSCASVSHLKENLINALNGE